MKPPELVNVSQDDLDKILALAKPAFPAQDYELLEKVLRSFMFVMLSLQNAKTSIKRFRQMLFGARTESKANVLKRLAASAASDAPVEGAATLPASQAPAKPAAPGHGRNGAQMYCDSPVVEVAVPDLHSGDPCPECTTGKVYDTAPSVIVKVIGQAPLSATVYKRQQLRCRLCDATFTAPMPDAAQGPLVAKGEAPPKYDPSCASILALLRYGGGMPFYRLEGLQASLNVPLPDATQWDLVLKAVPGPRAAFGELIRQAAQAELLYNDDTPARVLGLQRERVDAEAAGLTPVAKAISTTGIVAQLPEHKVVLFFTGHEHAGKNLSKVLAQRAQGLDPPMQMCDALAANVSPEFATVLANCLCHGRRLFADVIEHFPTECSHVIDVLAKVYAADDACRTQKMSPEQRLAQHKEISEPLMSALHKWMNQQFDERLVEPNSGLGRALRYMLNHWSKLTLFLRRAGAPLDNNICERALKRAIRHRRNSLFYKNRKGAEVGDIYMSLIHTCELCKVNPFAYLQALQIHAKDVMERAAQWLPWNYRKQLAAAA